jgi:hypothetical protein
MNDKEANQQLVVKPGFLSINQITAVYGLSRSYLYQLRYERKILHYELGSRTFIKVAELEDLIERGKK